MPDDDWVGSAIFGGGGKYRYVLKRKFLFGAERLVFVMLNPSTATAEQSDPTVRRCEGYSRLWGYGELCVVNLFALRSTDPKALKTDGDPVGPENNAYIKAMAEKAKLVVCAWGVNGVLKRRDQEVLEILRPYTPHYLKLTDDGIPMHPLYLRKDLKPMPFFGRAS